MKGQAVLILFGVVALATLSLANDEGAQRKKLFDDYRTMEGEVVFYGKVVDQHGTPIPGACVKVSVPTAAALGQPMSEREKTILTADDGRFEVSKRTYSTAHLVGRYLYIEAISKDGYESQWNEWLENRRTSFSFSTSDAKRFVPDAKNPIIYTLRAKGETTALLEDAVLKFQVPAIQSGKAVGYDFIQRGPIRDVAKPAGDDAARVCDLQVKATFNTNDATWTAVLSPGNTNGGIIVSEQLLYEAPETGYQPEYTFIPEDRKPVKAKYVYLKSRDPAIYTRLEIEHINANKDFFRLSGKSVTNPYGDRNLEPATDLPYEVTKQLTDEAKTAFRQNKRPTKPDLPKLIKEAKDKANKGKP